MEKHELRQYIKDTVRKEVAQVLMCQITKNANMNFTSAQRFPAEGGVPNLRLIYPYGFAARPPVGMQSLLIPIAGDGTNMNVVGQFDSNRPNLADGEAVLYGPNGQVVYMKADGTIHMGGLSSTHPYVLGDLLNNFLNNLLTLIIDHTHAAPGAPPTNVADFEAIQESPIQDDTLLSTEIFGQ